MENRNQKLNLVLFALLLIWIPSVFSQVGVPIINGIPDDPAAETTAQRWYYMDGNRVWLKFFNNGQLANWPDPLGSIWPKGSGINMSDGFATLIQAKVWVNASGIPLPIGAVPDTSRGDRAIYFCETQYREDMDVDPTGQYNWGYYPVRGYLNLNQEKPAISNDDNSWPLGGWPDRPDYVDTLGVTEWNGYFGRGKTNADLEAYFVINDAWDVEYQQPAADSFKFYARPGYYIGQGDYQWGGIGSRVGVRLFQWAHPQAQDVVFAHFDIANVSDYDYDEIMLSFYIDTGIGGDWNDDFSTFDSTANLGWFFDEDGVGSGGIKIGLLALAYLESPGFPHDGYDNDDDGIIDEQRDNPAGEWTEDGTRGPNGTTINVAAFESFYYPQKVGPHWTGDENQNWRPWTDVDSNGIYEPEFDEIGDDVGSDGVQPDDVNYYGPDPDGTEMNGRPDMGESNFGRTDKDESDQVGLTTFMAWNRSVYQKLAAEEGGRLFKFDKNFWDIASSKVKQTRETDPSENITMLFASGPVPIKRWTQERFSVAELHTWDHPLAPDYHAPALMTLKKTVQAIYNNGYRFAKPPEKPKLTAIPGDGKVTLVWDTRAEKSKEPFYNYIEDFEGYKIIKSTEPYFEDARVITDGYGNGFYFQAIAQFDLQDDIKGFADWGIHNGVSYYIGEDTGLKHLYIDDEVTNGRTYYYAVVAYDFGWEADGLMPSENTATITLDQFDQVDFVDRNCAVVTPRAYAAGYVPSRVDSGWTFKSGNGTIKVNKLDPTAIREGHTYAVNFVEKRTDYDPKTALKYGYSDDKIFSFTTATYVVLDVTDKSQPDTLLSESFGGEAFESPLFDGLKLDLTNKQSIRQLGYYWESEKTRVVPTIIESQIKASDYSNKSTLPLVPWDYSLHFTADSNFTTSNKKWIDRYGGQSYRLLQGYKTNVFALNHNFSRSDTTIKGADTTITFFPDTALVSIVDGNRDGKFNWAPGDANSDFFVVGEQEKPDVIALGNIIGYAVFAYEIRFLDEFPKPGDVLHIKTRRPFAAVDQYQFTINATEALNLATAKVDLERIKVVPNPYVATNLMEPQVRQGLNQRRRLMFTHIPAKCTISIYSVSGYLINTIEINNDVDDGHYLWDMQTQEGLEISYGLYLYRVDAPGIGEKVGKFAVIK